MALAARRARNLDDGFQVVQEAQVADASRRMANRITLLSLLAGIAYAGILTVLPI